jgi:hypothetical protein
MGVLSSLFSSPKPPVAAPVVRMPDQNDPAALEARKQQQRKLIQGTGRESTNLTGGFTGTRLGD